MTKNVTKDWLNLSAGLDELIGGIPKSCAFSVGKAVRQSVRKTAKDLRSGEFGNSGKYPWSDEYMQGFSSRATSKGLESEGEVGNKAKPGLVHLLEKGHLTMAGRRTRAYPHMAPAFASLEEDFLERANRAIIEALEEG